MPKTPTDHKPKTRPTYGWADTADHLDLELPSGNVVQVRQPDPQRLIAAGLLDEFDGFTAAVADTVANVDGATPQKPATDLKTVVKQLRSMDRIVVEVVVQPTVVMDREDAVDGAVWVDGPGVTLTDKTFIVQHATSGVSDLARFRAGPAGALAGAPAGP